MQILLSFSRFKECTIRISLFLIVISLVVTGCRKTETPPPEVRGGIVQSSFIATYTPSVISDLILAAGGEVVLNLRFPVNAIRTVYYTEGPDGSLVKASGVMLIPDDQEPLPLLSIQHGTETKRSRVASANPSTIGEGLVGLVTASLGFATCLPDYLGLGESVMIHPYLLEKPSAGASLDLLRAYRTYLEQSGVVLNGDLYLGGYSEGGYVTLALMKEIEENHASEFRVTACAPMAGPYDLDGTIRQIIRQSEYREPAFIAYFLTAYNDYYGWNRLDEIFKSPYAGNMESLFDGNHTTGEINNLLPGIITELLQDDFKNGYLDGTDTLVVNAVKENTLLGWKPSAPVRFYHSNGDEIVPYENALTALQDFTSRGAVDIQLVTTDSLHHSQAALPAYTGMIEWFDSLRIEKSFE